MFTRYAKPAFAVLCAAALALPAVAHADATKNLQVAGRALTFLEGGPTGTTRMGVVFDPSKPASVAEKNEVMAAIGAGYDAGAVKLVGTAVEAGAVAGSNAQVLFVTKGVNYAAVGAAAKGKKIITISSDAACANSGACVMAVATEPKVEIIVNRATASAVGAAFKAAFRMMIKEV
ncbi:hypothetical protein [Phenylobacterium sp.]|jgi:hypothetical protein|uniref:hypothetical protein n=1 Tax=Phenylobacterium sp. TaxID=1871053 RepID=UPI000C909277|nr:hypothetical protein [Phenylobacterium sp.]MAK81538.1 hypothetical protein [Phenylobacterium sp.]|tara:strand:- start:3612 stop:4139 length:528 start_codon:yes stop_codon:yes gene_type:complete